MLAVPFFGGSGERRKKGLKKQALDQDERGCESLSVIVPAYNEEENISGALQSAQCSRNAECQAEIIVVDGGSTDKTKEVAKSMGARVIEAPKGRATQMNAGARAAHGEVLLFLHSDCTLPPGYQNLIHYVMRPPEGESQAEATPSQSRIGAGSRQLGWGAFSRMRLDGPGLGLRLVEKGVELRTRWKHLPYGDQAIFIHRQLFEEVGGYPELPLMEDYQLVRDLRKRGSPKLLDATVTASARRWQQKGVLQTTLTNQCIILAYKLGVPPERLAQCYRSEKNCLWEWWRARFNNDLP